MTNIRSRVNVFAVNNVERAAIARILKGYGDHPFLGPINRSARKAGDILVLTSAQTGALLGQLEATEAWNIRDLKAVYWRIVDIKKQTEREDDVEKTWLPDGRVKLDDGETIIIRTPMHWEKEELRG